MRTVRCREAAPASIFLGISRAMVGSEGSVAEKGGTTALFFNCHSRFEATTAAAHVQSFRSRHTPQRASSPPQQNGPNPPLRQRGAAEDGKKKLHPKAHRVKTAPDIAGTVASITESEPGVESETASHNTPG